MSKNIVVCCDGTGNSFENIDEDSNVVKLYSSLVINDAQRCYYHPGVGTMGSPNRRGSIAHEWARIRGLAFGAGLLENLGDAYRYLMDTYVDGDAIYLFGFSRGAFTARALASLLHVFGLLCAGNHGTIPYVLQMYAERSKKAQHRTKTFDADVAFQWQFSHTQEVRIHFCGVWDTVSSYGWAYDPIDLPFLGNNPIIDIGRQAISLDERRCYYQDNLWGEPREGQDIRQVWFRGVHSDVGGSYPEKESGLSKIALEWMLVEAAKAGLQIDRTKADVVLGRRRVDGLPHYVGPEKSAIKHESLHGAWWILEYLLHQDPHLGKGYHLPRGRRRTVPQGSIIHESAIGTDSVDCKRTDLIIERWVRLGSQVKGQSA